MRSMFTALLAASCLAGILPVSVRAQVGADESVAAVLDALHAAASEADGDRYFALFAEDGVFLGTDATERWTVEQFKAYALPFFEQGRGWTYSATERHVYVSEDGTTAWFDERLSNASLGDTRGTGVLVLRDGRWKVAQYNLTIPVPNELASDLVARIRASADPAIDETAP
ncbi:MAG: nuclear transport factor 2 family protein [Gemmatimonadota bacterium]